MPYLNSEWSPKRWGAGGSLFYYKFPFDHDSARRYLRSDLNHIQDTLSVLLLLGNRKRWGHEPSRKEIETWAAIRFTKIDFKLFSVL